MLVRSSVGLTPQEGIMMQTTTTTKQETRNGTSKGLVYRTTCHNPGCGFTFDLRITPETVGMLSGPIACPRCRRHGGSLKSQGKIGDKLFAAKLIFRVMGTAPAASDDEDSYGVN
jgi:hypothetical protein